MSRRLAGCVVAWLAGLLLAGCGLETLRSLAKIRLSGISEWWVGLWSDGDWVRASHIIHVNVPASLPARMARPSNPLPSNQLATQPTR